MATLAKPHRDGRSVPQNEEVAVLWYRKVAALVNLPRLISVIDAVEINA